MIRSAAAAAAALVLCGLAMSAPSAAGAGGGSDDAAARASLELRVGASELVAVPAASRALFAKVLGRLEGMRGEMEELKADKRRSDERIARLEESDCECGEGKDEMKFEQMDDMKAENDEKSDNSYDINGTARHRKQADAPACGPASWAARTAVVMDACCPTTPGGHRRAQDTTCPLPDSCPSAACAAAFVTYYDDCSLELQGHAAELPLPQFAGFYASCQELASGAGQMLQPVAVQMFRVLVNTEGVAQAGAMSPGGGAGGGDGRGGNGLPLNSLQPVTPVPPRTIVTLMVDAGISTDLIIQPGERRGGGRRRWTQDRLTLNFCSGRGSVLRSTGDAAACLAMGALSRSHRCCLSGGRGQQPGS